MIKYFTIYIPEKNSQVKDTSLSRRYNTKSKLKDNNHEDADTPRVTGLYQIL